MLVPWRTARYLARAIMLKPGRDLEYLKHDLRRIAMGTFPENKQIRHPFLAEEGRIRANTGCTTIVTAGGSN